ncbi:MAG: hypothetical protein K5858_04715 [Lachnospiraceae bacterium]|nr:hypothetical protein [Lachnospiraceae bacterium]
MKEITTVLHAEEKINLQIAEGSLPSAKFQIMEETMKKSIKTIICFSLCLLFLSLPIITAEESRQPLNNLVSACGEFDREPPGNPSPNQ